jgi:hypothetical protein
LQFGISRIQRWTVLDWALAVYSTYIGVILLLTRSIPQWAPLVLAHALLLILLWLLPPRGSHWEVWRDEPTRRTILRRAGVFLRHMYPLVLILLFFEEGQFIVNAIFPDTPYWFEPYLYEADRRLFGNHPGIVFLPWLSPPLNELMHFFYFSYFVVLIGGPLLGRLPPRGAERNPSFSEPGFESAMTSMTLGFLCAYVWYPWLPARGPFENAELIGILPAFEGGPFTFLARWITDGAHVTGNCFPSAHVAGTWGVTFGLLPYHRRMGVFLVLLALGVSISCVYTRYHHGVDVPAGFLMGLLGAGLYRGVSSCFPAHLG